MPKSVWDYRRYIFLVQFLANEPNPDKLRDLCIKWNIPPVLKWSDDSLFGLEIDEKLTIERLAKSVLAHYSHSKDMVEGVTS